jgi:hypothetical protein
MMSRACATLNDLDFFSDDSSSSEEDEMPKRKTGDFTGLCLMGKSSRHISDSDFDVSDDSSPESLSIIPRSEKEGTKPPYVCPGCSNHTYSNNIITRFHVQ